MIRALKEIDRCHWQADQLFSPYEDDWPVRNMAPLQEGGLGKGSDHVKWRNFDDVEEEGVGTEAFVIPEGTAEITVETGIRARHESLKGGVCLGLYVKQLIRDGLGYKQALAVNKWGQWTSRVIRPVAKIDRVLRIDMWSMKPSSLNLDVGEVVQLELTRAAGERNDNLVGDLALIYLDVVFYRA